jgi:hypothetical protein
VQQHFYAEMKRGKFASVWGKKMYGKQQENHGKNKTLGKLNFIFISRVKTYKLHFKYNFEISFLNC